ncbi:MAG: hypothetical protein OXC91_04425, partial [Rhodobacteraceae bacterium]|nr:hypothetical protein [Paracoccaceae bacterium]
SVSQSDILIDGQSGPVHEQPGLQSTVKAACQAQLGTLLAPRTYRFFTDPVAFSRAGPGRKSLKA